MSVSLSKGQGVSLKKNEYDLSSVTIGLGWDINEEKKGFLGGIFVTVSFKPSFASLSCFRY